jgi:hypothetical protein
MTGSGSKRRAIGPGGVSIAAHFHSVRCEGSSFGDPSSNTLYKGPTPYGWAQLLAKSGLDYLDAPPLSDDAAISYDGKVQVEVHAKVAPGPSAE